MTTYNEQKCYTAKVKNHLTNKTKFFDVFAPSISKAILLAEELGSLFFCTASVECIACGLNRLGKAPAVITDDIPPAPTEMSPII